MIVRISEKKVYENTRRQIANSLRLELDQLDEALENWSPSELRAHLERFPAEVLDSPAAARRFTEPRFR